MTTVNLVTAHGCVQKNEESSGMLENCQNKLSIYIISTLVLAILTILIGVVLILVGTYLNLSLLMTSGAVVVGFGILLTLVSLFLLLYNKKLQKKQMQTMLEYKEDSKNLQKEKQDWRSKANTLRLDLEKTSLEAGRLENRNKALEEHTHTMSRDLLSAKDLLIFYQSREADVTATKHRLQYQYARNEKADSLLSSLITSATQGTEDLVRNCRNIVEHYEATSNALFERSIDVTKKEIALQKQMFSIDEKIIKLQLLEQSLLVRQSETEGAVGTEEEGAVGTEEEGAVGTEEEGAVESQEGSSGNQNDFDIDSNNNGRD